VVSGAKYEYLLYNTMNHNRCALGHWEQPRQVYNSVSKTRLDIFQFLVIPPFTPRGVPVPAQFVQSVHIHKK
jgi:hypothetical protein